MYIFIYVYMYIYFIIYIYIYSYSIPILVAEFSLRPQEDFPVDRWYGSGLHVATSAAPRKARWTRWSDATATATRHGSWFVKAYRMGPPSDSVEICLWLNSIVGFMDGSGRHNELVFMGLVNQQT